MVASEPPKPAALSNWGQAFEPFWAYFEPILTPLAENTGNTPKSIPNLAANGAFRPLCGQIWYPAAKGRKSVASAAPPGYLVAVSVTLCFGSAYSAYLVLFWAYFEPFWVYFELF